MTGVGGWGDWYFDGGVGGAGTDSDASRTWLWGPVIP